MASTHPPPHRLPATPHNPVPVDCSPPTDEDPGSPPEPEPPPP